MKHMALFTLVALSTFAPIQEADACGGSYVPELRIHQLSSHHIPTRARRSFVVLGGASNEKRPWAQLAPRSYDSTKIAQGVPLARPMTFTIVGVNGTKVVTGRNHVFLASTFAFLEAASAIEVPWVGDRALVIEGSHADAKWVAFDSLRDDGITLSTSYTTDAAKPLVTVKRGADEVGRFMGRALGVVTVGGERRLVFGDGAWTSSVAI